MIYRAINPSDGNVLEVQMLFIHCTTFGKSHVKYYFFSFFHFRYQQVYFQCRRVAVFPTQRSTFTHLKKIFCVSKQHRGFLGHERKLLLSWLECLVRLKRIKSLKINDGFETNRPCSVPQRIVRLDKCGFFPRLSSDTIDVLWNTVKNPSLTSIADTVLVSDETSFVVCDLCCYTRKTQLCISHATWWW